MAQNKKATKDVDKLQPFLEGVAKSLVDRLYGPAGPAWGTKFTEVEATVAALRHALTEKVLHQALARQAVQAERPPEYGVCPGCGRPTPTAGQTKPRQVATGHGEAVWDEPKTRCEHCWRDFFPAEPEFGN